MLAMKRLQYIINQLEAHNAVLVSVLSKEMGVTEETVRRDLEKLEKQGRLCRVHGGAYLSEGYSLETSVSVREQFYREEKTVIAEKCMELVNDKDALMLDCSTTAKYIAQALVASGKTATVITNSLLVANEVSAGSRLRLIQLGGDYSPKHNAFFGEYSLQALSGYYADKVFISGAGLSLQTGITDYTRDEATMHKSMMERSRVCYFAGDLTKIGRMAIHSVSPLDKLGGIVTDRPLELKDRVLYQELVKQGVKVLAGTMQSRKKTRS